MSDVVVRVSWYAGLAILAVVGSMFGHWLGGRIGTWCCRALDERDARRADAIAQRRGAP